MPEPVLAAFDLDRRAAAVARRLAPAAGETGEHTHVALAGDEVIGFVTVTTAGDPAPVCADLEALYVRESWYGTGVADDLVHAALDPAIPCRLWVFADAPRARAFYRRHGWVPDGARKFEEFTALAQLRMSRYPDPGRESSG